MLYICIQNFKIDCVNLIILCVIYYYRCYDIWMVRIIHYPPRVKAQNKIM